jgi:hypothetical protein
MGYLNPLLALPAARAIAALPQAQRRPLERLLRELRAQANEQAELAWARRKAPMAAYYRAVSSYARHCAHVLSRPRTERNVTLYLAIEADAGNPEAIAKAAAAVLARAGLRVRTVAPDEFVQADEARAIEPAGESSAGTERSTVCYGAHLPTLVKSIENGLLD